VLPDAPATTRKRQSFPPGAEALYGHLFRDPSRGTKGLARARQVARWPRFQFQFDPLTLLHTAESDLKAEEVGFEPTVRQRHITVSSAPNSLADLACPRDSRHLVGPSDRP
jgi:hypothetical protein